MTIHNRSAKIGKIIKELRRNNAINGVELADKIGISQSKLSKIETGQYPTVDEQIILRILNILNTPKTIRQQMTMLLGQADTRRGAVHTSYYADTASHIHATKRESDATQLQIVMLNCIPALLQTIPYRMALLTQWLDGSKLQLAIRETITRQDHILTSGIKSHFIIHQAALYTLATQKPEHVAQLDRLDRLLDMPNIRIGIIPVEAGLSINEHSNFAIVDSNRVTEALLGREVDVVDPDIKADYLQTFDELDAYAVYGNEARMLIHKAIDYRL